MNIPMLDAFFKIFGMQRVVDKVEQEAGEKMIESMIEATARNPICVELKIVRSPRASREEK